MIFPPRHRVNVSPEKTHQLRRLPARAINPLPFARRDVLRIHDAPDPLVPDAGNRLEQSPFNQTEHGFVVNLQQAGHFFGGINLHGLTHDLGVAAPHQ